jgi:hypothetical protein
MGKPRFIYANMITDEDDLSVYSLRPGMVTSAIKEGTGSALIATQGNYTGTIDREYTVEIDSIAGGAEVGQATFKWSDGTGSWNASGVTTPSSPTTLNNGVQISFASGSGADFALGDQWFFKGVNLFNAGNLIDRNRDTRYRSNGLTDPEYIAVDLGSAQAPTVLILQDHNVSFGGTIILEGDSAATFDSDGGAAEVIEAVSRDSGIIVHYLTSASPYRYWRVKFTDAGNPDGYIEIGEWFLGTYFQPSRSYGRTPSKGLEMIFQRNETRHGLLKHRYFNKRKIMPFEFTFLTLADIQALETMIDALNDQETGEMAAFWFNEDSAYPASSWLVNLYGMEWQHEDCADARYRLTLELQEVITAT